MKHLLRLLIVPLGLIAILLFVTVPDRAGHAQEYCEYTVQSGDFAAGIAEKFGMDYGEFMNLNDDNYPIWSGSLTPGWVLLVNCTSGSSPSSSNTAPSSPASSSATTATPRNNLNLRKGPSTSYSRINTALAGVAYPVIARDRTGDWILVDDGNVRGWVAAWLTDMSGGTVTDLPESSEIIGEGSAPSAPSVSYPTTSGGFAQGGQTHTFAHPDVMRSAGMTWVKFQHRWGPGQDPSAAAWQIESAHAQGFKVLLSVLGDPADVDYHEEYARYVGQLAAMGADGIEIWNEMNFWVEWPVGRIDPALYVNTMLAPSYRAIKAANPGTMVISGAPGPTGVNDGFSIVSDDVYIAGMRDAGAANYMDCLGIHYNAGATSPSQTFGHPADSGARHYSWYFWTTYGLYANTFPRTQLCFTEIGFLTPHGYPPLSERFWWGGQTDIWEHASWLAEASRLAQSTRRVSLFIVFNVDIDHYGDDPQAGYAILRNDGSCPACSFLAAAVGR